MSAVIIGNQLVEEAAEGSDELPSQYRKYLGMVAHRLLWTAVPGDVVVLPNRPEDAFIDYVWRTLGYEKELPVVMVPPTGARDDLLLYPDRLLDGRFIEELRSLVKERGITNVNAFYHDSAVAMMADAVGLPSSRARGFLEQSGSRLVNSKSVFRAVASGLGIPIPSGLVTSSLESTEKFVWDLVAEGGAAIVKQDGQAGGYGNEVVKHPSHAAGFGASKVTDVTKPWELAAHVSASWDRWSAHGTRDVVVEEYHVDSIPLYAELWIGDAGADLVGHGEMRTRETEDGLSNAGLIIPAVRSVNSEHHSSFLRDAQRLADALWGLGYRGVISVDSILLASGHILLNEFNGRISGSTHIHALSRRLLGESCPRDRVVLVRTRRKIRSVEHALQVIAARGVGFNPADRSGVIIGGDDGQIVFFAPDLGTAEALESCLADSFNPIGATW